MEKIHAFSKSELSKFVNEHSGISLSCIDDIIIDYMVSVLEDIGTHPDEFETSFDVEEFTQMISGFIDGFCEISSDYVANWMFSMARRIENGSYLNIKIEEEVTSKKNYDEKQTLMQESDLPEQLIESSINETNINKNNNQHQTPSIIQVQIPNSLKWLCPNEVTAESLFSNVNTNVMFPSEVNALFPNEVIINSLFPEYTLGEEMNNININQGSVNNPYSTYRSESPPTEDLTTIIGTTPLGSPSFIIKNKESPIKMSKTKKLETLQEMFSGIPVCQLKKCLSRFKWDIEKAIKYLVGAHSDKNDKFESSREQDETPPSQQTSITVDPIITKSITQLKEIFPSISESRIRDRLLVFGGDIEKTTQVLLAEEEGLYKSHINEKKFQVHQMSSKKVNLSVKEEAKLKHELVSKYGFWEEGPARRRKDSYNRQSSNDSNDVDNQVETSNKETPISLSLNEEKKPQVNSKLHRKSRFR